MDKKYNEWLICAGCALAIFCTCGLAVNLFIVYQPYILQFNDFTNTQVSTIVTVRSLTSFVSMFITGWYYKKLSYRLGLSLCCAMSALSFFLFGLSTGFGMYCVGSALAGLGYGMGYMIPVTIMINRWFTKNRLIAMSLCASVTGLATLGFPSAITYLIERYGLKVTFTMEAAVILAFAVISYLLLRDKEEENEQVSGEVQQDGPNEPSVMTKSSWFIAMPMLILLGAMTNTAYSHLSMLSSSEGFSGNVTAIAIMIVGIALTVGKLIYGTVAQKTSIMTANSIFGICTIIGLVLLCFLNGSVARLYSGIFIYGCGLSFTTVGLAMWSVDLSGPENRARIVRIFNISYVGGNLLFSPIPGILADANNGSYRPAYRMFVVFTIIVLVSIQYLYHKKKKMQQLT